MAKKGCKRYSGEIDRERESENKKELTSKNTTNKSGI